MFTNRGFKGLAVGAQSILLAAGMSACGGGGGGGGNPTDGQAALLGKMGLVQASKKPLNDAQVQISLKGGKGLAKLQTDSLGFVTLSLEPGTYDVEIMKGNQTIVLTFEISSANGNLEATLITPLDCDDAGTCENVDAFAIIASFAGVITSGGNPVSGAQVALSGGAATGGAFATAVTDSRGAFNLLVNVSNDLASALQNATLTVSAPGFRSFSTDFAVVEVHQTGVNVSLESDTGGADVLFRETFEQDSETLEFWTVDGGFDANTTWHRHTSGLNITNDLVPGFVNLPPNESGSAAVPNPVSGSAAFWYGSALNGSFIGEQTSFDNSDSGGTSTNDHAGTLTSPSLDFSNLSASTPVALRFLTFWEIESVNPNCDGFDLMTVSISTDGGNSFAPLARLNPLSDPQASVNRDPLGFSNTGFNSAPAWLQQEAIPLDGLQGEPDVQFRFEFSTEDSLFNGFRGWLIDDIEIIAAQGTFPTISELSCTAKAHRRRN